MKKHKNFILFFGAVVFIFLGRFIFMQASFLYGDYLQQFYPWSKAYSEAIKTFSFPFWTSYINSGFPLMAEGQLGGFYPPNIIMFFLLPFNLAYNYSIILHFVLAGVFTYIYARKIESDEWGAALSALIFCFGSSFAGCPYLRTLIWFPLALFIIEKYFDAKKLRYILYLGIILGLQFLAGFVQMAVYSALFYLIYFLYGLKLRKNLSISDGIKMAAAFFTALVIFSPQLILSFIMAGLSSRAESSLGFALWGSFIPFNIISLCFPKIIIYGSQLYVGVFSLIFLIYSVFACRKEIKIKPIFMIFLISFFLALGAYNPLYVLFVKITRLYGFRNPSKFVFFAVFALAVLSGRGFTQFFKTDNTEKRLKALRAAVLFIAANITVFISLSIIFRVFKGKILELGRWYVSNYIFRKDYHRHYMQNYFSKVDDIYVQIVSCTSILNPFTLVSLLLCIAAVVAGFYFIRHKPANKLHKTFFIAVISLDLFIFSFYGIDFGANVKPFSYAKPTHGAILHILKSDRENFRILPFGLTSGDMPWWVKPSANILVRIDSVAAYTPLVQKIYRDKLSSLEVVDNSLGLLYPKTQALKDNYNLLRLLNVKYIISSEELNFDFLEKVIFENKIWLYKVKGYLPRVFFSQSISGGAIGISKEARLDSPEYKSGFLRVKLSAASDGFLVFSENNYPGWIAYVDGMPAPILKVNDIVQAVKINSGEHKVIFKYGPYSLSER